jgi:dihydrofolate synthase/folylpolyglutamate synthase
MMELALLGVHQAANAAVVVATIEQLRQQGWHIPDASVADGLAHVDWPARMEVVSQKPFVVLDCAHNVASAEALVETLQTTFPPTRRWLIFAGSGDKDVAGMFRALTPHFERAWMTRYTNNPRAIPAAQLAEMWGPTATVCATPTEALHQARREATPNDLICITGSVFLAGELRPLLINCS